jgi:hypothetical protein
MITFSTYSLNDVRKLVDLAIAAGRPASFTIESVHNSTKGNPVDQYEYKGTIMVSLVSGQFE